MMWIFILFNGDDRDVAVENDCAVEKHKVFLLLDQQKQTTVNPIRVLIHFINLAQWGTCEKHIISLREL